MIEKIGKVLFAMAIYYLTSECKFSANKPATKKCRVKGRSLLYQPGRKVILTFALSILQFEALPGVGERHFPLTYPPFSFTIRDKGN